MGAACGAGGSYCTSTLAAAAPSCTSTLANVLQDGTYPAHTFGIDNHGLAATTSAGSAQATNTVITVNNVAPTISSSSITIEDAAVATSSLTLTVEQGQTPNFKLYFTVTDANSCEVQGGGNEIVSSSLYFYRSGFGQASCTAARGSSPSCAA